VVLRHGHGEQLAGARDIVCAGRSGEQAVVADAVTAFWKSGKARSAPERTAAGAKKTL
jgi:hypothetical protein